MPDPRSVATTLASRCASTFGSELRSAVLFGSAARGEAIPGVSDVNVLLIFDEVDIDQVSSAAPLIQDWVRGGNSPPHIFSLEEWQGMRDSFAIEISDMQDAREVVHGDDPVPAAALQPSDIRLHAEHEIRDTMLHMRLRMFLSAEDPQEVGSLLLSGLPSFAAYMRAALRVCSGSAPLDTGRTIEEAAALIDADPEPMLRCHRARMEREPPVVPVTDPLVESYHAFARQLSRFIDRIPQ